MGGCWVGWVSGGCHMGGCQMGGSVDVGVG